MDLRGEAPVGKRKNLSSHILMKGGVPVIGGCTGEKPCQKEEKVCKKQAMHLRDISLLELKNRSEKNFVDWAKHGEKRVGKSVKGEKGKDVSCWQRKFKKLQGTQKERGRAREGGAKSIRAVKGGLEDKERRSLGVLGPVFKKKVQQLDEEVRAGTLIPVVL